MIGSVTVWDLNGGPPPKIGDVLCWQSYFQQESVTSVPRYLEDNSARFREKYLAFIHDLGESLVDGKRIVDHLDIGEGLSFWWMTQLAEKSPFKSPCIYNCLRLMALEEILLQRKPSFLTLQSCDSDLAKAIRRMCQILRIGFSWRVEKEPKEKWSLLRSYRSLPHPIQGLISLARDLANRWSLRKLKMPHWFSGNNSFFLFSYFIHLDPVSCAKGKFHSRQWEKLPKYLHDNGKQTNWIHHFLFSAVVPNTQTGLAWLGKFNIDANRQGLHAFLDSYLTLTVVYQVLKNWCRLNIVNWRLRDIQVAFYPRESASWLWPILRNDWCTSLNGQVSIKNCMWVTLFDAALKAIPHQNIGLYLCENQGWERAFLHAWRKHGHGQIIAVPHATVPFWHLYYFDDPRSLIVNQHRSMPLPDLLAINGAAARAAFAKAGYPEAQLVDVEALRYMNLAGMAGERRLNSIKRFAVNHTANESTEVSILVLGEMVPSSMHQFLCLVENAIKLLPLGYKFTLKPHPGYAIKLADYPALRAEQITEPLDCVLGQYDIALSANSTSAAVDAYVAGLPVIIGLDGATLNLSPLRGQSGVCFVSTPKELSEALQSAAKDQAMEREHDDFFYLDPDLPRWKQLLSVQ